MTKFELEERDRNVINEKNSLLALTQIKEMTREQKEEMARLMGKMIIVDDPIVRLQIS